MAVNLKIFTPHQWYYSMYEWRHEPHGHLLIALGPASEAGSQADQKWGHPFKEFRNCWPIVDPHEKSHWLN